MHKDHAKKTKRKKKHGGTHVVLLRIGAGERQRPNNNPLLFLKRFHQQHPTLLRPAWGGVGGTRYEFKQKRKHTILQINTNHHLRQIAPVSRFGRTVLEVLVGLVDLSFSPALAANEFHFQVEGAPSSHPCSQSSHTQPSHRADPSPADTVSPSSSATSSSHSPYSSRRYAAARMGDVYGLEKKRERKRLTLTSLYNITAGFAAALQVN